MSYTKKQAYLRNIENMERFDKMFPGYFENYIIDKGKRCCYCVNKILAKCDEFVKKVI